MNRSTIILRRPFACFHRVRMTMCAISALGFVLTACGGGDETTLAPTLGATVAAITTVAGTGRNCPKPAAIPACGDGLAADVTQLTGPAGLAVDATGNVLIADASNHRIRKVDVQTGLITTVAGNGVVCTVQPCGDDGQADLAQLHSPLGIAVDAAGNVLIADQNNHRVRRVDAQTGIITTVAGTGSAGFNGDNQPAIAAHLNFPTGVAADVAGNLFIADQSNHRVRRVDVQGNIMTIAGTGNAGFDGDNQPAIAAQLNVPTGVAVDTTGNVFIADQFNQRVRVVNAQTGIITTVAGNGTACANPTATPACGDGGVPTAAQLNLPNGLALDGGGNLLIADFGNHRVRRVMP